MMLLHPGRAFIRARDTAMRAVNRVRLAGDAVYCPLCGQTATRFLEGGICFECGSRGRQRLLWSYLASRLDPGDPVLHVAPEPCITQALRRSGVAYSSLDLASPYADVHADLTDQSAVHQVVRPRSCRWILCSHVLEHVTDEIAALRSMASLLALDGVLVVQVPHDFTREATYEDWSITTPEGRLRAFGQEDHVRIYGRDLYNRLAASGLGVRPISPNEILGPEKTIRLGVDPDDPLYVLTPRVAS
jgi:hypothetical protein